MWSTRKQEGNSTPVSEGSEILKIDGRTYQKEIAIFAEREPYKGHTCAFDNDRNLARHHPAKGIGQGRVGFS